MFAEFHHHNEVIAVHRWDDDEFMLRITGIDGRVFHETQKPDFITACEDAAGLVWSADHAGISLTKLLTKESV